MENIVLKNNQRALEIDKQKEAILIMDNFYRKNFESGDDQVKRISLEILRSIKEKGITIENFLDYICKKHGLLMHGSIEDISDDELKSEEQRIYASNKSAIAIMRSLYSNLDVDLGYPYHINEENPLVLEVHTPPDGTFIKKDKGFIYIVKSDRFRNEPESSWQFVSETGKVKFIAVIETENEDFKYPVGFFNDLDLKKEWILKTFSAI